jgi:hypothetical protein
MKSQGKAPQETLITMVGDSQGLDFLNLEHRKIIITILDAWKAKIEIKGKISLRRESIKLKS